MAHPWGGLFSSDYMPHGHCYLWEPPLVVLEVATNASIGLAYLAISLTLVHLVRRVRDLPFQWVYVAFGLFIVTCGFTHFMDVWVIWRPHYWLERHGPPRLRGRLGGHGAAPPPLVPRAVALAGAARLAHGRGIKLEELNVELSALYEKTREAIAEAIPNLVWTAAPDGSLDYVNPQWVAYIGARTLGWDWHSRVAQEDVGTLLERWKRSLLTGEPYEMECRLRREDGELRWFLVRALPLRAGSKIVRWFGTCTDIHERKLLDEERERFLARARDEVARATSSSPSPPTSCAPRSPRCASSSTASSAASPPAGSPRSASRRASPWPPGSSAG